MSFMQSREVKETRDMEDGGNEANQSLSETVHGTRSVIQRVLKKRGGRGRVRGVRRSEVVFGHLIQNPTTERLEIE